MKLDPIVFYRKYGIRRIGQLLNPTTFPSEGFSLPRESDFHSVSHDDGITMPDANNSIYQNYSKKIWITHITELASDKSNPKRLNKLPRALTRAWQITNNTQFRYVEDPSELTPDMLTLVVYNYGLLNTLYRYIKTPVSEYNAWFNIEKTLWYNVNNIAEKTHRQQFVFMDLPTVLPSVGMLKMFSEKTDLRMMKIFDTPERRMVLELWKWVNPETRALSTMSDMNPEAAKYVNLVIRYKSQTAILNLGKLVSWSAVEELPDDDKEPKFQPMMLQKFILKLFMVIQSKELIPEETDIEPTDIVKDDEELEKDDDDDGEKENLPTALNVSQTTQFKKVSEINDEADISVDISAIQADIDDDLKVLDNINTDIILDANDNDDNDELTAIDLQAEDVSDIELEIYNPVSSVERNKKHIEKLADSGVITAATYREAIKQIDASTTVKSPYDPNKTINEFSIVNPELLTVKSELPIQNDIVEDKNSLTSSTKAFTADYIKNVLPKDIVACTGKIANAGILIKSHTVEKETSAMGYYEHHTVKVKPIDGQESTLHFRVPLVDNEGELQSGGVRYRARMQRTDLPIRKISPSSVALSSYYGKVFVNRSERVQYDELTWLANQIRQIGMSGGNDSIRKIVLGNLFINNIKTPSIYSAMSMHFKSIVGRGIVLDFDYENRDTSMRSIEGDQYVLVGQTKQGHPIVVDYNDEFFVYKDKEFTHIGDIYYLLSIDRTKAPVQFSEVKIFSKNIPLVIAMSYYIGITKLIKLMKANPKVIPANKRINIEQNEYVIKFKDYKLIFNKSNKAATLVLSGLNFFKDVVKLYNYDDFNHKHVFLNILEHRDIPGRYLKELDNLKDLFIDPITEGILRDMNEPLTFQGLLMRSNELLLTNWHPDNNDMQYMRIRGYERIAGMLYRELSHAIRDYRSKAISNKSQVSLAPYAVWNSIMQDQTVKLCEDINPINDIKEMEAVTYVGGDGRAKDAMSESAREFHPNDIGIMSEATVDSGDVAINTYLSANANFKNLRGIANKTNPEDKNMPQIWSTTMLLAPGSLNDDLKRVLFVGVQQAHTVACDGYKQTQFRTGYEYVAPYKAGKLFATMAEEDGKVVELDEHHITIQYKSGKKISAQLGRYLGRAEGSVYVHDLVTGLKLNQSIKKGDAIAYNDGFFEADILDPTKLIMKTSTTAKLAFMDSSQTIEDSSAISRSLSETLQTRIVKEKTFVIGFNQNIRNMVSPGKSLTPKDILFIIEDEITSGLDSFDSDTIESLSRLSNLAPKAKVIGTLDRYEVYYNGDLEDMSPSLRKLAMQSNKELRQRSSHSEFPVTDGRVTEEFRVEGKPLNIDTAVIKVYIIVNDNARLGDKVVFANQMKSIVCEVMSYDVKTESNETIDAIFGYKSINNRIVHSPLIIGTSITLLKKIAEKAVSIYNR